MGRLIVSVLLVISAALVYGGVSGGYDAGVRHELVMLPGWEQSDGAYIEFCLTKKSGKTIRELGGCILHQGGGNE